jgi:hypothetical protein
MPKLPFAVHTRPTAHFAPLGLLLALWPVASAQTGLVVPAGTTMVYDTAQGPLIVSELIIEQGATLRAIGSAPFELVATRRIHLDGVLDASGQHAPDVFMLVSANIPKAPGRGGPGGGAGGLGSPSKTGSDAGGDNGQPGLGAPALSAGQGGNSGYNSSSTDNNRRPGGGGGGRLAADEAISGSPFAAANLGLSASSGANGGVNATDAKTGIKPPKGGAVGQSVFQDGNPNNDFFGVALDAQSGSLVLGELSAPVGGSGGGAGGDAIQFATFPQIPWNLNNEEAGAGGGGGGGVARLRTRQLSLGPTGRILANGGDGARGESTNGINNVAGGSGGGSGGMLIIQALQMDLSQASPDCLSARGGRGGPGQGNVYGQGTNAGGMGGPGLIQLHNANPLTSVILPAGLDLADLSAPNAKLLLPLP